MLLIKLFICSMYTPSAVLLNENEIIIILNIIIRFTCPVTLASGRVLRSFGELSFTSYEASVLHYGNTVATIIFRS